MERYLFLDFDGVLHPSTPPRDFRYAQHLIPIVTNLGIKIVISSTWREVYSLQELIKLLGGLGQFVVGKTPLWAGVTGANTPIGIRQREIEAWLARKAPSNSSWAAIDDDAENFHKNCKRVFITDNAVGLDAGRAVQFDAWCKQLFLQ